MSAAVTEKLFLREEAFSVLVADTAVASITSRDITRTGVRIYKDGFIGTDGFVGGYGCSLFDTAFKGAKEALKNRIAYPLPPETGRSESRRTGAWPLSAAALQDEVRALCSILAGEYPDFSFFSPGITLRRSVKSLSNDAGLELVCEVENLSFSMAWRKKSSVSIADACLSFDGFSYDREALLGLLRSRLECAGKKVIFPAPRMPVIIDLNAAAALLRPFADQLGGNAMEASLFTGKYGRRIFSPQFSLVRGQNPQENMLHFFDDEGVCADGAAFVENGVLKNPLTDKRVAARLKLPSTACAAAAYDGAPAVAYSADALGMLKIVPSDKTVEQLLAGSPAVYINSVRDAGISQDGGFALFVDRSFLLEGGKLRGTLPGFTLSSDICSFFGRDFAGISADTPDGAHRCLVVNADIKPL